MVSFDFNIDCETPLWLAHTLDLAEGQAETLVLAWGKNDSQLSKRQFIIH